MCKEWVILKLELGTAENQKVEFAVNSIVGYSVLI